MIRVNEKIETCPCPVCRSDLAYIVPCQRTVLVGIMEDALVIETTVPTDYPPFPIPLLM